MTGTSDSLLLRQPNQVLAVRVFCHGCGQFLEFLSHDPAVTVSDVLQAGDLEAGALLQNFHEDGGLGEGIVGAGVQPGEAAAEDLNLELSGGQEFLVDSGDLQLAAGRWLDVFGDFHHLVGVEIKAHHGVVALGALGFLLYREAVAGGVELGHAVTLGVGDPVAEDGGFVIIGVGDGLAEELGEAVAVEDVVAQHEADAVVADELFSDYEGLGKAVGRGLLGILKVHAEVAAISQQPTEPRQIGRRGYYQNLPYPRQHQCADGIVDHWLVVYGQQLLADAFRNGVKSCAGTAG